MCDIPPQGCRTMCDIPAIGGCSAWRRPQEHRLSNTMAKTSSLQMRAAAAAIAGSGLGKLCINGTDTRKNKPTNSSQESSRVVMPRSPTVPARARSRQHLDDFGSIWAPIGRHNHLHPLVLAPHAARPKAFLDPRIWRCVASMSSMHPPCERTYIFNFCVFRPAKK